MIKTIRRIFGLEPKQMKWRSRGLELLVERLERNLRETQELKKQCKFG